jgi:hypothetical protein
MTVIGTIGAFVIVITNSTITGVTSRTCASEQTWGIDTNTDVSTIIIIGFITFVDIIADLSSTSPARVTRAGKCTNIIGARGIDITVMIIGCTFIDVTASSTTFALLDSITVVSSITFTCETTIVVSTCGFT